MVFLPVIGDFEVPDVYYDARERRGAVEYAAAPIRQRRWSIRQFRVRNV
jgi:hypothetical protein